MGAQLKEIEDLKQLVNQLTNGASSAVSADAAVTGE